MWIKVHGVTNGTSYWINMGTAVHMSLMANKKGSIIRFRDNHLLVVSERPKEILALLDKAWASWRRAPKDE
jgi:hypothetical protein